MKISTPRLFAAVLTFGLLLPAPLHAYYNPGTGRWLSRDPIAERSFQRQLILFCSPGAMRRAAQNDASVYAFATGDPVCRFDILGLDVYKLREKSRDSCCPDHRLIVGDMGDAMPGWSYVLEVAGPDGNSCCGVRNMKGTTLHLYQSAGHHTAAEAVEIRTKTKEFVVTDHVYTDSDVDAELSAVAQGLKGKPWRYIFIWSDCGTFANQWLSRARSLQREKHPVEEPHMDPIIVY